MEREAIVGKMDKTFDFLGVHMGLKYKDAAQPLKGGKIQLKVDDLKKIFPQAHSNKVEVDAEFDGGVAMDDGLFKMVVHYSMVHSDGEGEEKGEVKIERKQAGNMWTTTIKTSASPFGGKTIIPEAINNLEIMVESDRQTKLHAKYVNPTKNRDIDIKIDRVPGKSLHLVIVNGDRKHDLTFKVGDLNFKKMDGIFNIAVEGTSLGEAVKGKITGSKKGDVQVVQFDIEKGNKKVIQLDTKFKMDIDAQSFEARTKYAVLSSKLSGKVLLKYADKQFTFKNTDGASKDTLDLTAKIDVGKTADIEAKKNGESMWTYKTQRTTVSNNAKFEMTLNTQMTLSSKSKIHQFLSQHYPYGAYNTRNNKVRIFVDRQNKNLLAPKFKIGVHLQKDGAKAVDMTADTTGSPYVFKLTAPNFFERWGIKQSSIDITADHKNGSSLVIDANILGGLHLESCIDSASWCQAELWVARFKKAIEASFTTTHQQLQRLLHFLS